MHAYTVGSQLSEPVGNKAVPGNLNVQITEVAPMLLKLYDILDVKKGFF